MKSCSECKATASRKLRMKRAKRLIWPRGCFTFHLVENNRLINLSIRWVRCPMEETQERRFVTISLIQSKTSKCSKRCKMRRMVHRRDLRTQWPLKLMKSLTICLVSDMRPSYLLRVSKMESLKIPHLAMRTALYKDRALSSTLRDNRWIQTT